jgi:hypothetical protein
MNEFPHPTHSLDGGPPAGLGLGDERAEDLPLGVGQVGAVAAARRRHGTLLKGEGTKKRRSLQPFSDAL